MKWLMRMLSKTKKNRRGFTLIELMVVLIIIAILAVAAVPTYMYFVHRAYESEAAASLGAIKTAQIVYWAEKDVFADTWVKLGMATGDFTQNKWFESDCFWIYSTDPYTSFTAYANGDDGKSEVAGIYLKLTDTGDVEKATLGEWTAGNQLPAP
jgi:prepilin-type N-terminal cleavage/methylation domain-containing protein